MKNTIFGIVLGLALGAVAVWFLKPAHEAEEKKDAALKEVSFVQHGTNGETFLKLDAEAQARMGLKLAPLAAATVKPEITGYGRVIDPTPLAALLTEVATAEANVATSKKELQRTKLLFDQGQNVSQRALEMAEIAVKRDEIALDGARMRVMTGWGSAFMPGPKLVPLLERLVALQAALVRVDLPLSESLKAQPTGARVAPLNAPESFASAEFVSAAPSVDPQMQAQGFFFLMQTNPLPPGAAVIAWVGEPGESESGVVVPRSALLRHEGRVFVYRQTAADQFTRSELKLVRPLPGGWFVDQGLKPQDRLVVTGAQQLLSEELKSQIGE